MGEMIQDSVAPVWNWALQETPSKGWDEQTRFGFTVGGCGGILVQVIFQSSSAPRFSLWCPGGGHPSVVWISILELHPKTSVFRPCTLLLQTTRNYPHSQPRRRV